MWHCYWASSCWHFQGTWGPSKCRQLVTQQRSVHSKPKNTLIYSTTAEILRSCNLAVNISTLPLWKLKKYYYIFRRVRKVAKSDPLRYAVIPFDYVLDMLCVLRLQSHDQCDADSPFSSRSAASSALKNFRPRLIDAVTVILNRSMCVVVICISHHTTTETTVSVQCFGRKV